MNLMKTIKFRSNLPISQSIKAAWKFGDHHFKDIPNTPGIYIVGVKIFVSGQGEVFCPLYVGIRNNLNSRIKAHWKVKGYLNGQKELFDLKMSMNKVYKEIELYNEIWMNSQKKVTDKLALAKKLKTLIWFNSPLFFDRYLGLSNGTSSYVDSKYWHQGTLEKDLPFLKKNYPNFGKEIDELTNRIVETKKIISEQYYYVFHEFIATDDYKSIKPELELIEAATKKELESRGLFTYGHVSGAGAKSSIDFSKEYKIDLSEIESILLKLT